MEKLNIFIPITKVDEAQRLVYGVATAEKVDKSNEIMDYDSTLPFYKEWSAAMHKASGGKSYGNVREMHSNIAAGKLTQINFDDVQKQVDVCAKIIDDSSWNKVLEGVLTGFSHGGEYVKRWKDENDSKVTRYTAKPAELSVVDNPCLGAATFEMIRADGSKEMVKFKTATSKEDLQVEPEPKAKFIPEQVWKASDGNTFAKKDECLKYEAELEKKVSNPTIDALNALSKAIDEKTTIDPSLEKDEKIEAAKQVIERKNALIAKFKEFSINIKKGFAEAYDCKTALEALCLLECLISGEEWESMMGEGEEGQIVDLKEAVSRLKAFIAAEIMEGEEMEMAAGNKDLEKAGARHSAIDKGHLSKAMGHLADAKGHHEDAVKAHGKMGDAHTSMEKCYGAMQDCMKALATADLLKTEDAKGMKTHLEEASDHLDKAMKQHGKMGKAHTGMATDHEGIGAALGDVGAESDGDADKSMADEMKKVADELAELKKQNEELAAKNTTSEQTNADLTKTLGEVNKLVPQLMERVKKLELTPLPPKGALYDAGGGGVVKKGHEIPEPDESVETLPLTKGLSPEAARRFMGIS